ncbi:MAG: response regulator [Planctomycetota bacterium]|jgi:CheY-like chemotaxis protein
MGKANILIVDDDLDYARAMKTTLEAEQYTVRTAANRTGGMEEIRADKPNLVILDVMMSTWQEGFEMSRELKGNPEYKEIPILILTGLKEKVGVNFKSSAGDPEWMPVDGFLDKPVEPDTLLAQVERLLSQKTSD